MPIKVKKQPGENSRSLVRRFSKIIRKSRILAWSRKNRYYERPKSTQAKKKAALRREELKKEYAKLIKLGKAKKDFKKK